MNKAPMPDLQSINYQSTLVGFNDKLSAISKVLFNSSVNVKLDVNFTIDTNKVFKGIIPKALGKVRVYRPNGLYGNLAEYVQSLINAIDDLKDLEKRLYKPLIEFIQSSTSVKGFSDKIWAPKKIELINTGKHIKEIGGFFVKTKDATKNGGGDIAVFGDIYDSARDFNKAQNLIVELAKKLSYIDLDSLKESEKILHDGFDIYLELLEDEEVFMTGHKENLKLLGKYTTALVMETELLATVIYNSISVHSLHKETSEHLVRIFK